MDKKGQLRIGKERRPVDDLTAYLDYKIRVAERIGMRENSSAFGRNGTI
jgi:hypothetical protein